ncbi:hypothetical protein AA15669_1160 [Saccharibacter floricola DSM 15669]|uniref:Farnesoic acid O-methyl transferase domain-containing protein n=2 Tax=Saccharibacter TaxID=231052 RepID=A0ABQ0NZJ0_9PROT|nr:hypothetical protein AA15669_1160 [Saccharibacter floricola DSM 15669]
MGMLRKHIRSLLDKKVIDEWHVWDFTRNERDKDYIAKNYGPAKFLRPDADYQKIGSLTKGHKIKRRFRIAADFHLALKIKNADFFIEYVTGGWKNSTSVMRKVENKFFQACERDNNHVLCKHLTPGIFHGDFDSEMTIELSSEGIISFSVNGFVYPETKIDGSDIDLYVKGGLGSSLEMCDIDEKIFRFIGDVGAEKPYWQAYQFYTEHYKDFKNDIFLKCDDDIVYLDEGKLPDFIRVIRDYKEYFLISANVLNNGVCASLQQEAGNLPKEVGIFEKIDDGFGGSLWESGEKARALHEYFVMNNKRPLLFEEVLVEHDVRISINFVGWRGENLRHMAVRWDDDEGLLSVEIPKFLKKKNAIFSDFMVSHLSFFTQEETIGATDVIKMYENS